MQGMKMDRVKMLELAQTVERELHAIRRYKPGSYCVSALKPSEHFTLRMLYTINEGKKVMPSQLAKKMELSLPAITHQLKALEKHGYVMRQMSKTDRRRVYVSITSEGRALFERIKKEHQELMFGLIEYLGEEDSLKLVELVSKLVEYIKCRKTEKIQEDVEKGQ